MPSDSNIGNLPPSPIDNDDLWLINRDDNSYKVNSLQLGGYLVQIEIPKICESDDDCPSGTVCLENFCTKIPCEDTEDCPDDHVCFNGFCYPICDIDNGEPCTDGFVCVDPGNTEANPICLPYPFPCDENNLPGDGCPPGYICWGGYCWHTCSGAIGDCPPGMICVESLDEGVGFICVYPEGGFPCVDGACPDGFDCFFGMCFARCDGSAGLGGCGEGFVCVETSPGNNHCVPYPFPCDLYSDGCPPGMICYNGECFIDCSPDGTSGICEDGFHCIEIDGGHSICYPDEPKEKFVNDGPLIVRTEPVDYPDSPAQEKIIFTANQFGRSVLTFQGFTLNPGGPGGGVCDITSDCPPGYSCVGGICVLLPCQDDVDCDTGLVCFNGFCFPTCSGDSDCPTGYECVDGICLPGGVHPIGECTANGDCPTGYVCVNGFCVLQPCPNGDSDCPTGFVCYNNYCYKECDAVIGCPPNHICVEVSPGNFICMPIGGGPEGGGSGGDININIDPDWWDPDNPKSPIGDGGLIFPGSTEPAYTANQKEDTTLTVDMMGIGDGKLTFPGGQTFTANQDTNDDVDLTLAGMGIGDGKLSFPGGASFTANQATGTNVTLTLDTMGVGNGKLQFKNKSNKVFKTFTANQSTDLVIDSDDINDMIDPGLWKDAGNNNIMPLLANKNVLPNGNNTSSLGNTSNRWSNIFTNDLHLSNEGHKNDVDGTWGSYTIQEGEDDLFLINKRTGKKYRFLLDEVK